eukprot:CAMPEP_0204236078 /NCGR_PEP_ID=MMETSP0361-20130328/92181_1 /ASSEMBLY_ACC=CAM_ASM_000343 /TAXON_ID=268821 /ORGANISM="Scrippsiella Hangoei, Strain SHTV-5" /LENGTH=101 /DNA_ID=CAMNT_0051207837 /DNA_START=84 /DNA_END=386 /DNA_ORIENTATION=-
MSPKTKLANGKTRWDQKNSGSVLTLSSANTEQRKVFGQDTATRSSHPWLEAMGATFSAHPRSLQARQGQTNATRIPQNFKRLKRTTKPTMRVTHGGCCTTT